MAFAQYQLAVHLIRKGCHPKADVPVGTEISTVGLKEWQPAFFVNFLSGSSVVLKILERFLDAGSPQERDTAFESQKGDSG